MGHGWLGVYLNAPAEWTLREQTSNPRGQRAPNPEEAIMAKFVIAKFVIANAQTTRLMEASKLKGKKLVEFAAKEKWFTLRGEGKCNEEALEKYLQQAIEDVLGKIPQESKKEAIMAEYKSEAYSLLSEMIEKMEGNFQYKKQLRAGLLIELGKDWWLRDGQYKMRKSGLKSRLRAAMKKAQAKLEQEKQKVKEEMEARRKVGPFPGGGGAADPAGPVPG